MVRVQHVYPGGYLVHHLRTFAPLGKRRGPPMRDLLGGICWGRARIGGLVSTVGKNCFTESVVIVILMLLMMIVPAAGQARHSSSSRTQERFSRAVDKTLREGLRGSLPPHISTLLGIAQEEECPVMQGVVRTGNVVQGIDVSTTNRKDVVLFVADETTNDQALYLTSAEGTLRRVVMVQGGVGNAVRITEQHKQAFEKEKRFWMNRLVPADASQ